MPGFANEPGSVTAPAGHPVRESQARSTLENMDLSRVSRSTRRSWRLMSALLALGLFVTVAVTPPAGAAGRYSIMLMAFRPTIPNSSTLYAGKTVRVDAVGFLNGNVPHQGTVSVESNDPTNRSICIISLSGQRDYCDTVFASPGRRMLSAVFRQSVHGRSVVRARKRIAIEVQPAPVMAQATTMLFDAPLSYYSVTPSGGYTVQMAGLLSVVQAYAIQLASPGAGVVSFTDATGATLCQVTVPPTSVSELLQCTGGPYASPPVNPITAHYSGTNAGLNDGSGVVYALDTSAPANIGQYP